MARKFHGFALINRDNEKIVSVWVGYSKSLIIELFLIEWIKYGMTTEQAAKHFNEMYKLARTIVNINMEFGEDVMKKNPGKISHKACVVLSNDGAIKGIYLGWSYTMVRNYFINELIKKSKLDRAEAMDYIDEKFTFEDNIKVVGYQPLKRSKKQ